MDTRAASHRRRMLWCLVVFLSILPATLAFRPAASVVDPPLIEDGYYVATIARHIALGHGVTIDGTTPTNGFQPLFAFLLVPLFWLASDDRYLAVRYLLLLHWTIQLATAYVLARIAGAHASEATRHRPAIVPLITAALYLASPYLLLQHYNGLETGLVLLLYAVLWRYCQQHARDSGYGALVLGLLSGLLLLARIDSVFFVGMLGVQMLRWSRQASWPRRLARLAQVLGSALLVSLPWWLYNLWGFGHIMPTSGRAQQAWALSASRVEVALSGLLQVLAPAVPLLYAELLHPAAGLAALVAIVVGLAATAILGWRWLQRNRGWCGLTADALAGRTVAVAFCLLASGVVLVLWYVQSSFATWFYARYFAPIALVATFASGLLLGKLYERRPGVAVSLLIMLMIPLPLSFGLRYWGILFDGAPHYHDQLALIREHVPDSEPVAAFQSGTIGYFRDGIVNLDGKVNSQALARRDDIPRYLAERRIAWLVDWGLGDLDWVQDGWVAVARRGEFVLYHAREPYTSEGWAR